MICQECQERPATLHFTKIINGEKTEIHICEQCAKEKGDFSMFSGGSGFSFNNLLAGLLNFDPGLSEATTSNFPKHDVLQCDRCKMTYQQFVKVGRFGCSHCYEIFQKQLDPVLKRLHSGNTSHAGKIPNRIGGNIHIKKEIEKLRSELHEQIKQEEFEKAAQLRDKIRELESSISGDREGEQ